MDEFFQEGPQLRNTYEGDDLLRGYLARVLPSWTGNEVEPRIFRMGARAASDLLQLSRAAELEPPRLVQFDAWGRRVDRIETSAAWRAIHAIAAEEGLVSVAYERRHGEYSRLVQFALLYLFHPSSAWVSCPLAMTDGAARVLELHADETLRNRALPRLLSRDPSLAWTSGQWMTERAGGSDVSGTDTTARAAHADGHSHRLYGTKWFSSATTSEMALTLARLEGAPAGSRGLTLFYLETRGFEGAANGIRVLRLKDKLGTRALPTAELQLDGTLAVQVGAAGEGVRTVATMLNITRLYNACCAAGTMRRAIDLARDYASRRRAFGRALIDHPLHRATIAGLEVESRAALVLVLRAAELLGRDEVGAASAEERAQLRLLTPLAKLLTGKQAVAVTSEALECFGGAGYIEDTGLPRLSRDAQVLPIWEGTTNVLALDVQRVLHGEDDALRCLLADVELRLRARGPALAAAAAQVSAAAGSLIALRASALQAGEDAVQASARSFALGLARVVAGALLIEHGAWELATRSAAPTAAAARAWAAALAPAHGIEPTDERLLARGPR